MRLFAHRLPSGGLIDRSQPLRFSFDGRAYTGFGGDTLASALVANGVRLVGRSFKYHRPRGILTAGSEEPNALVTLRGGARAEPNTRATTVVLYEGLEATSQNRWPSLAFDVLAINQLAAPIFVAGFYYKTFMWPAAFWEKIYEPLIRRAAGLGKLSMLPDPDSYDRTHGFCDVLVIGGGPAGLSTALIAARSGARVIIAEEDWQLGGRLLSERHEINGTRRTCLGPGRRRRTNFPPKRHNPHPYECFRILRRRVWGRRTGERSPRHTRPGPAAPAPLENRREARGTCHRGHRTAARVRRQ